MALAGRFGGTRGMRHWQAAKSFNPSNAPFLKIAGFGACMISGYPHEGGGLFEVACALVEGKISRPVEQKLFTIGGFPAPYAEKYLKSRVLSFNPDYAVIQFGSTDAARPIRAKSRSPVAASKNLLRSPNVFTVARWHIQFQVGFVWKSARLARRLDKKSPRRRLGDATGRSHEVRLSRSS
jgi:hypothetical protein